VSVRLWEEVQALLRRSDDKLNPGWLNKKLGYRWLHGRLCRLPPPKMTAMWFAPCVWVREA
jgi:hypothetical protein